MNFRIIETAELTGDDDPRRWVHEASNRLWHDELVAVYGNDDLTRPLDAELRLAVANPERRLLVWAALPAGATENADSVVGVARLVLPLLDNTHFAEASVVVRPDARHNGVGSALARTVIERAHAEGRRALVTGTDSVPPVAASDPMPSRWARSSASSTAHTRSPASCSASGIPTRTARAALGDRPADRCRTSRPAAR